MFACNVVSQNCKKETSLALKNSLLRVCCHNQTWQDGRPTCTDLMQKVDLCIIIDNFKRFQYTFHSLTTSKTELDTQYKKLYTSFAERVVKRNKTQDLYPHGIFAAVGGTLPTQEKKDLGPYQDNKEILGDISKI